MAAKHPHTDRELELLKQIVVAMQAITANLKAFSFTHDWDELADQLKVHEDRVRPLMAEYKRLRSER